jgi:hypothetical protein
MPTMPHSFRCSLLPFSVVISLLISGCATKPPITESLDPPARVVSPRGVAAVKLAEPVVPDQPLGGLLGPGVLNVSLPAGIYLPFYATDKYVLYTCATRCLVLVINGSFVMGGLAQDKNDGSWHHWIKDYGTGSQPGPIALDDLIESFPRLPGKVLIYLAPLERLQPQFKAPIAVGPQDPAHLREPTPIETGVKLYKP